MGNKSTRDQIVEAADLLFYHQGFEHTSFSDIAGTVKISRGNFYYHFKSFYCSFKIRGKTHIKIYI